MINLYQAKLMNGENWVEIETTERRKNVEKKTKKKLKNTKRERWIGNGRKTEKRNNKQHQEKQWRNRQGVWTSNREISADLPVKKRQGKHGKGVKIKKKRRKIIKGKVQNWKWKVEKLQNERMFFVFVLFVCLFSCFCFVFVLFFHAGKKSGKNYNDFAPLRKIFLIRPWREKERNVK